MKLKVKKKEKKTALHSLSLKYCRFKQKVFVSEVWWEMWDKNADVHSFEGKERKGIRKILRKQFQHWEISHINVLSERLFKEPLGKPQVTFRYSWTQAELECQSDDEWGGLKVLLAPKYHFHCLSQQFPSHSVGPSSDMKGKIWYYNIRKCAVKRSINKRLKIECKKDTYVQIWKDSYYRINC